MDFVGLVCIHASVADIGSIVPTDDDFGHAYLTEGWALRFSRSLLGSSSVLFVSYSHADAMMSRLARALLALDLSRPDAPDR